MTERLLTEMLPSSVKWRNDLYKSYEMLKRRELWCAYILIPYATSFMVSSVLHNDKYRYSHIPSPVKCRSPS